jgi:Glycosyltransferase family 87
VAGKITDKIAKKFPWIFSPSFPWILFAAAAVIATLHRLWMGPQSFNNYVIFERSFFHLLDNTNLYVAYPDEQYDLFKYSPTFAALMAPLSIMPRFIGVMFWNLLNMLLPVWALSKMNFSNEKKNLIFLLLFIELLSSVQNAQSNGIMLGLIAGAFVMFERKNNAMAMLLIAFGFHIKLFAAVAGLLLFFYPGKIKSVLYGILFTVILGAVPLLAVTPSELLLQYRNWLELLTHDPAHELNYSIMTLSERLLGIHAGDLTYLIPGAILLMLPLLRIKHYSSYGFRLLFTASVLIWVVIFNHKAESPTYCIAFAGILLWYFSGDKSKWELVLLVLAFVFVALSPTDLFPRAVREAVIKPYSLKALFPIAIWIVLTIQLLVRNHFYSPEEKLRMRTA